MNLKSKSNLQLGQTLIETIAAIAILVTCLTAGLALAIYVLGSSGINQNEIVATSFAREGVEMVRMIRDTNWLGDDGTSVSSYNLQTCSGIAGNPLCYPRVRVSVPSEKQSDDIKDETDALHYDIAKGVWSLDKETSEFTVQWDPTTGIFGTNGGSNTNYARKITISSNTSSPYSSDPNNNSNGEIIVKVTVGWMNVKHCPKRGDVSHNDPTDSKWPKNCKVSVEEHLTNWKDY